MPERHDRQLRGRVEDLEVLARLGATVEQVGLREVAGDRVAELLCAVRAEGEPRLERTERPRVLQGDVDGMQLVTIGVDPDRDWITLAVVDAHTTGVIAEAKFPATSDGYRDAVDMVDAHSSETERAWAIEGSASYGRGLAAMLAHRGEWVMPAKVYLSSPPHGDFRAMPARGGGLAMLKWISSFPGNPVEHGISAGRQCVDRGPAGPGDDL